MSSITTSRSRTSATDGDWMDVATAAMYAGVSLTDLTAAVLHGELPVATRYGPVLVHSHAVEAWAAVRESLVVGRVVPPAS
jgi:hypothetical protein